jgi:hypothetical protein
MVVVGATSGRALGDPLGSRIATFSAPAVVVSDAATGNARCKLDDQA